MNERLKEIAIEAKLIASEPNGFDQNNLSKAQQKFAELIVAECNEVLRLVPYNSNVEFGDEVIYQDAIKEHFGVEE